MTSKLSTWLLVALAGGAFIAGCGSSSTSTSTTQGNQATTSPAGTGTTTGSVGTGAASSSPPLTPAQAKQAASTCKSGIQKESAIPTSAKGKLEKTCEKVASGGSSSALRQVAEEACVQLIDASHLPAGAVKERALSVCKVNNTVGR